MKQLILSILMILLPMLAMGQTNDVVLAEVDYTKATEFTGWYQFDNSQTDGKVELKASEGLAITVGIQTGEVWQPSVMVIPDGSFDLEEDGNYKVIITAKFPTAGSLQINMGTWAANDQDRFSITASNDFQTIECDFESWSCYADGAHLLFMCGDFKGTTILKNIKVLGPPPTPYNPAKICYNYIAKGKVAEVISNPNLKYRGIVEIPSKVTHEGVEYTVTKIADNAFSSCTKLSYVTIPNSVTSIGDNAFNGCSSLTSITIPNSLTSIGDGVFNGCVSLASITIPNSVTSIESNSFYGCSALTSVTIPNSVTSIGRSAFSCCKCLTSVTIPNSVTSLSGFNDCSALTSVTIPNSVTSIEINAFSGCSALTSITIPNSVTSIGDYAFFACGGLTSVTIPNSVTSIGFEAFGYCDDLTSVTIPNSVTSIGNYAFFACGGLTSVTIPNSVTSIGSSAFKDCTSLTSVTIGEKVSNISSSSFANCPDLADVYCLAKNVPNTDSYAFNGSYIEYATLHVPAASLSNYSNAVPWKNFGSKVAIGGGEIPETQKCAKPTITFKDGMLTFTCATEGAEFISEITAPAMTKKYDNKISLSSTYTVTVYATKIGYLDSDKASIEIQANSGIKGDMNDDGKVDVADHVKLSNIIMNQ